MTPSRTNQGSDPISEPPHDPIDIFLVWNHRKHTIRVNHGTPYSELTPLLNAKIERHPSDSRDANQLAEVVGFTHSPSNLTLDYQLSIGRGLVTQPITLTPFHSNNEEGILRYQVYKCLAVGGFSKVYLVRDRHDGKFHVMKTMSKGKNEELQDDLSVIQNQKNINTLLGDHPFIVKLNDTFETENFAFFVLEYCPGGELFYNLKRIKRMKETEARFYFVEILHAFQHLHQNGVLYRDLKPENILIDVDGHIKLADFGLSKQDMDSEAMTYSYCGSAEYMAPEMILRIGHSFAFDFYTLGALLYEIVIGIPPFYSQNEDVNRFSILNDQLSFPEEVSLSEELKGLLKSLLNKNPKLRLGCLKGVKEIRFHPWVGLYTPKTILERKLKPPFIPDLSCLNFDERDVGDDEGEFTKKLKQEIRVLNRSLGPKAKSSIKLLHSRSNFTLKHNPLNKGWHLNRDVSPYLEKMSVMTPMSPGKSKIVYNSIEMGRDKENERLPQISKESISNQMHQLTKVYISSISAKRHKYSNPLLIASKYKNQTMIRGGEEVKKELRTIKLLPTCALKSTSTWK